MFSSIHVEIKRSPIQGYGIFAKCDLPPGIVIWSNPQILTPQYLWLIEKGTDPIESTIERYALQFSDDLFAGIHKETKDVIDMICFVNHSCDSNAYFCNLFSLITSRRVQKGEEITVDYATMHTYDWDCVLECHCSSAKCRGFICHDDWVLETVQEAQEGKFLPYVQEKIDTYLKPMM